MTKMYKNLLDTLTEGRTLPEGTDMWAIKTTHSDLRTRNGYRWPYPGNWATAPGPLYRDNLSPCPSRAGDGICVADTWAGMDSGDVPALTLLLCAIDTGDILGREEEFGKLRVARAYVVDLIDGERLIRDHGHGAYLKGANLIGANLRYANLQGAYLKGANLIGANLYRANLKEADLRYAGLQGTKLKDANLYGADLRYADLYGANLIGADLKGANLASAILIGADLKGANLASAILIGADLRDAELTPEQRTYAQRQGAKL